MLILVKRSENTRSYMIEKCSSEVKQTSPNLEQFGYCKTSLFHSFERERQNCFHIVITQYRN